MEAAILEGIECKVCKNRDPNAFIPKFHKTGIDIVQCKNCEFVFIPPYYRKTINYRTYKDEVVFKAIKEGNDWLKIQRHRLRYRKLKKYVPKGKLFDLGVGWGHFLYTGKLLGYEVDGIEIAEFPYKYAREYLHLPVENIDFFEYNPKTDYYDMITMWDVLEHIDNCDAVIEKCHTMLKNGGYVVIHVPQIDSYVAKKLKENWQAMGPDHVNYFSRKTITRFLEKNGFALVKIESSIELKHYLMYMFYEKKIKRKQGTTDNIVHSDRQEYYNKSVNRPKWQLKIVVFLHDLACNILSKLNIGDEMLVIARKK